MKVTEIDSSMERNMITGMIVSTDFISQVTGIYKSSLVKTDFVRTVASWCIDYFERYETAPGEVIETIFQDNAEDLDEDTVESINAFLANISDEYERSEKFNTGYVLGKTKDYFIKNGLNEFITDVKIHTKNGDIKQAEDLIDNYTRPVTEALDGVEPFEDKDAVERAFEDSNIDPLFTLPGSLGEMVNQHMTRGGFVSLMGPEKRGKTFWLLELAERARRQKCNIAFFACGDMSEAQMIRRMAIRLTGRNTNDKYCKDIVYPVLDCLHNVEDSCSKKIRTNEFDYKDDRYEACTACLKRKIPDFEPDVWDEDRPNVKPLGFTDAWNAFNKAHKRMGKKHYKLVTVPTDTLTKPMIDLYLNGWEQEGFIPDVILIDYMDIMASERNLKDTRHETNESWKKVRGLALERNCLVLTATQSDANSYDKETITKKNFSEDKRKFSHATVILGLNQTEAEKEHGIMRINEVLAREGMNSVFRTVTVLQSLQTGRPFLASYWTP